MPPTLIFSVIQRNREIDEKRKKEKLKKCCATEGTEGNPVFFYLCPLWLAALYLLSSLKFRMSRTVTKQNRVGRRLASHPVRGKR